MTDSKAHDHPRYTTDGSRAEFRCEPFVVDHRAVDALNVAAERHGAGLRARWLAVAAVIGRRYSDRDGVTLVVGGERSITITVAQHTTFDQVLRQAARLGALPSDTNAMSCAIRVGGEEGRTARTDGSDAMTIRMVLTLTDSDGLGRGAVYYRDSSIERQIAVGAARHASALVQRLAEAPARPCSAIEIVCGAERDDLLAICNGPAVGYAPGAVHEMFERAVECTPNAPALIWGEQRLTYAELNARADASAAALRRMGVGLETRVGLCASRSLDAIAAVFGILKAQAAYVPLDPSYPEERLAEIALDSQLAVVVSEAPHARLGAADAIPRLCLETVGTAATAAQPSQTVPLDAAAYVVYTSGSTGKPKGVVATHRSILNGLNDVPFRREDPEEVCCLNSSLSFGMSVARLFLPLLCGRPLVVIPDGIEKDLVALVDVWARYGIGNVVLVTPALRQLLRMGPRVTSKLRRVHTVVVGGAPLTPDILEAFADQMPQATMLNGFVATEIGGVGLLRSVIQDASVQSVGRPYCNTAAYVMDAAGHLVPPGVPGELCIGARHLVRGYLNRPALTAERFVPNPCAADGTRLYRTGDVARLTANGDFELLGRLDDQVKIRGFRIEVREIETVLERHEEVAGAAVAARDVGGQRRLIAYVVRSPGSGLSVSDIRAYLGARVPEYMLPSLVLFVDALPMTPTGKIDRNALPTPGTDRPELATSYEPPRAPTERTIAALWTTLLAVDHLGVHDHFLEVGGDSLFATLLTARVAEQFGVQVKAVAVFEHPTIAAFSTYLDEMVAASASAEAAL